MLARFAGSNEQKANFASGVPLKRLGRPEQIAEAILLSPPTKLHSLAEHRFLSTAARPLFNRWEDEQRKSTAKAAAGLRLCGAVEACAKVRQVEQEPVRCFSFSR
jgi:hypothetical protein